MIRAYVRVSTTRQNLETQLINVKKVGYDVLYHEKKSGVKERPELDRMLADLRRGDTVVVYKLDRIGRSAVHLLELVELFKEKDVKFVSVKDNIDTSTPMGMLVLHVLAAIAEFERTLILDRTMEGKRAAWERGVKKGRGYKHLNRYIHLKGDMEECLKPYRLKGRMVKMYRSTYFRYMALATDHRMLTKKEFCQKYGLNHAQYKKNFKRLKDIPPMNLSKRHYKR